MSRYLPISLALEGADCLVVGGGRVAARKARSLVACGAAVRVVSPEICPGLVELDGVEIIEEPFDAPHADGMTLVFAATDDPEVNRRVAAAARERGALVNVVDVPAECDFIVPSTLTRGDLTISVCSGGAAPALSRRIREGLEQQFPETYADFVALLAEVRTDIKGRLPDMARRKALFERLADATTWTLFASEGADAVRQLADRLVQEGG